MFAHPLLIEFISIGIFSFLLENHGFHEQIYKFISCVFSQGEALYIVRKNAAVRMIKVFYNTSIIIYAKNVTIL